MTTCKAVAFIPNYAASVAAFHNYMHRRADSGWHETCIMRSRVCVGCVESHPTTDGIVLEYDDEDRKVPFELTAIEDFDF